jgi:hypothetical protein
MFEFDLYLQRLLGLQGVQAKFPVEATTLEHP